MKQKNLMLITVREAEYQLTDEEYKETIKIWKKQAEENKAILQLVDSRNFNSMISPKLQLWVHQYLIAPAVEHGLQKVAFIESPDLFAQASIEQAMKENENRKLQVMYFKDETEAREWLLK